jgi:hypothetical protein
MLFGLPTLVGVANIILLFSFVMLVICSLKHILERRTLFLSSILNYRCVYYQNHISMSFMYEVYEVSSYWMFLILVCELYSSVHIFYLPTYYIYLFISTLVTVSGT